MVLGKRPWLPMAESARELLITFPLLLPVKASVSETLLALLKLFMGFTTGNGLDEAPTTRLLVVGITVSVAGAAVPGDRKS